MSILQAIILGAVQGITEFIPISSSGHLVLVPDALGWRDPGLAFFVLLHFASLLALLIYFSGELLDLARGLSAGDAEARKLLLMLVVGTIPAVVIGLLLADYFEGAFTDADAAAVQLVITAGILVAAEQILRHHERATARSGADFRHMEDMRPGDAAVIGVAQAIAILPGISRSGITIGAGLGLGVARDHAARFSFLLAIPALLGAAIFEVPHLSEGSVGLGAGAAGFAASLVTSYAAIAALIRYLRANTLYPFAAYCVIAGVLFLAVV